MKYISSILRSIIVICLLLGVFCIYYKCCVSKKLTPKQVRHIQKEDAKQREEIKQNDSFDIVRINQNVVKKTSVGSFTQFDKKRIQKISNDNNIKPKELDNSTQFIVHDTSNIVANAFGDFFGDDSAKDSIIEFSIKDTCTNGYAIIDINKRQLLEKRVNIIPIEVTMYKHRSCFLGKYHYRTRINSQCPNIVIDSVYTLKIEKE